MSTVQESNLSRATKIPEPKLPIGVDPRVASFIRPIVDILRVREGFAPNHDVLDKAITVRDLYKSGLIDILKDGKRHTYSGADDGPLVPSASVSNPDGAVDYTAPPAPTGLTASGAFANVFLTFDEPSSLYGNHSFTEVWRSGTNDIGSATYIGSTTTRFYADEIGAGGSFYYWVRFVSKAGKVGPFNAISGTLGETSYDHSYVLDTLTVAWKASTAYTAGPPPDYVIPSPGNRTGLWYKVVTAGTSGTTEPTWPTVVGNQVTDGTVVWEAIAAGSETIPFTVGEVAGSPAVVMSAKTFIADASIESAKIKDLIADKITAGTITAAIEMTAATMTGGLLRTSSGTGQRVEISGSDAWPLWFGSGTKGDANGKFMLKSDGSLYVKDHTGATILQVLPSATSYGAAISNDSVLGAAGGLLPNWNFEVVGTDDKPAGVYPIEGIADTSGVAYGDSTKTWIRIQHASDTTIGYGFPAIPIDDKQKYTITIRLKSTTTDISGLYLGFYELNTSLPSGITYIGAASSGGTKATPRTSWVWLENNTAMPGTSWVERIYTYTPTSGVKWASFVMDNWGNAVTNALDIEFVQMMPVAKTASDIAYGSGATVEDLKPAQAGADVTGSNTALDTTNVNGTPATTVATAVTNFNSRNDRDGTAITAPTIATDGTAVDHTISTDGSANLSFEWAWTGTNSDIDGWVIYIRQSTSSAAYTIGTTPAEEQTFYVPAERRAVLYHGVPADQYYTFGVQAYRVVDTDVNASGVITSSVVQPSLSTENPYRPASSVAFSGDLIGTINGAAAGTLANASTADWQTQVTGTGKPSDNADQTQPALEAGVTITSGGVTLSAGGAFKGGQTDFNTGVGVFLGYSGTAYKFSVGDPNGGHLTWDGSALTTRSGTTGKRIEINPGGDNEIHFWGDRGDGTIEELATIGINLSGSDYYVGLFGSTNAGNSRVGIAGLSNSRAGVYGYSAGYYGVYASTGASTLPALYATGTYCAKLAMNSPNSGGHLVMAPNNVPPTHTAEAGTFYMDSTAKLWINEGGSTWRLVGTQPYSASTGTTGSLANGAYTDINISGLPSNPIVAFTAKCNGGSADRWTAKLVFDDGRIITHAGVPTIYTSVPATPSAGSIRVRLQQESGVTTTVTWRLDVVAHW